MKHITVLLINLFSYSTLSAQVDTSTLSFDTLRIPGYIINTSGKSTFFVPIDNHKDECKISDFLTRYFPTMNSWDPKKFEDANVFMFNSGKSYTGDVSLNDVNIFEDYEFENCKNGDWEMLNKYLTKQILPGLTDSFQFFRRNDEKNRKYNVYFLDAVWIKIRLDSKTHESPRKTQSTIRPNRNEKYYYCYVLIDYYSFGIVKDLNDNNMIEIK